MASKLERKLKLHLGGRVNVEGKGGGVLKFFGPTKASKGAKRCGIALDAPNGTHDGAVNGSRYFTCSPGYGCIVKIEQVTIVENAGLRRTKGNGKAAPSTSQTMQSKKAKATKSRPKLTDHFVTESASTAVATPKKIPVIRKSTSENRTPIDASTNDGQVPSTGNAKVYSTKTDKAAALTEKQRAQEAEMMALRAKIAEAERLHAEMNAESTSPVMTAAGSASSCDSFPSDASLNFHGEDQQESDVVIRSPQVKEDITEDEIPRVPDTVTQNHKHTDLEQAATANPAVNQKDVTDAPATEELKRSLEEKHRAEKKLAEMQRILDEQAAREAKAQREREEAERKHQAEIESMKIKLAEEEAQKKAAAELAEKIKREKEEEAERIRVETEKAALEAARAESEQAAKVQAAAIEARIQSERDAAAAALAQKQRESEIMLAAMRVDMEKMQADLANASTEVAHSETNAGTAESDEDEDLPAEPSADAQVAAMAEELEKMKQKLAEVEKEKEETETKSKLRLKKMAQKVFSRLQGEEAELREAEQERRELKEWERQAALQAKEREMEAEALSMRSKEELAAAEAKAQESERLHREVEERRLEMEKQAVAMAEQQRIEKELRDREAEAAAKQLAIQKREAEEARQKLILEFDPGWTSAKVTAWLASVGFPNEAKMFADEDLDAGDILVLEPEDLDELGITDESVRDRLLKTLEEATAAHRD